MANAVDYDPERVMENIVSKYCGMVDNLASDLNKLAKELDDCQDKFHCKGGSEANAVMEIYKGFQTAIGKSNGNFSGEGLGGLTAASASILNTVYSEAKVDWERLQQSNNFKF